MQTLEDLSLRVRNAQRAFDRRQGELSSLETMRDRTSQEVDRLRREVTELEKVSIFLNSIGEEHQLKAQQSIETLVTQGLQTIFDDTLTFHILQKVSGKTSTVEFVVRTHLPGDRVVETSVLDARGGGLAAVVGFLLRLVVLLLRRDDSERLLILDETFAHVSEGYLPALSEFLRTIVDRTGVQIIMVTHQDQFTESADKVYRFSQKDGFTVVKEVTE